MVYRNIDRNEDIFCFVFSLTLNYIKTNSSFISPDLFRGPRYRCDTPESCSPSFQFLILGRAMPGASPGGRVPFVAPPVPTLTSVASVAPPAGVTPSATPEGAIMGRPVVVLARG